MIEQVVFPFHTPQTNTNKIAVLIGCGILLLALIIFGIYTSNNNRQTKSENV